jgi:hypothetical protein
MLTKSIQNETEIFDNIQYYLAGVFWGSRLRFFNILRSLTMSVKAVCVCLYIFMSTYVSP